MRRFLDGGWRLHLPGFDLGGSVDNIFLLNGRIWKRLLLNQLLGPAMVSTHVSLGFLLIVVLFFMHSQERFLGIFLGKVHAVGRRGIL